MAIDKIFDNAAVDGIADNLFNSVSNSVSEIKAMQQRKAAENVQLVIQALKKIDNDIREKYDGVTTVIEKRVATIKDGRDGINGKDGRDGKDGRNGKDGAPGPRGMDGARGMDGRDGEDGVSVTDAHIDFDGSLIISLSSGRQINVGEVVAPDLAEKIKVITNGGGTSQGVLDTLTSLQNQINVLVGMGSVNYVGTWNASTNTPTIVAGTGDKGDYYVVSVAGTTSIDGQALWGVGDWIIFNGTAWQKVDGGSTGDFTNLSASGTVTFSGGTANGVAYLNGSKVLTTGSALTFDGTTLGIYNGTADAQRLNLGTSGTNAVIQATRASGTVPNILFQIDATERMRLNSSGNLGIGTTSPAARLDVRPSATNFAQISSASHSTLTGLSAALTFSRGSDGIADLAAVFGWNNGGLAVAGREGLVFATGGGGLYSATVERMRLDSVGNLGLGVTPSVWSAGVRVFEFGALGGLAAASNDVNFLSNVYFDGSNRYRTNNFATNFQSTSGQFRWLTAPSGTAGNAITFTQAMTLNASGELLLGQTASIYSAANRSNITMGGSAGGLLVLGTSTASNGYLLFDTTNIELANSTPSGALWFRTAGNVRARIDSGGNLLVGTATPSFPGSFPRITSDGGATSALLLTTSGGASYGCGYFHNTATSGNNEFAAFGTEATWTARGSITYNRAGGLVAYNTTSDYRAKDIIGPVENSGALIDSVPVYMGKMKGATQERPMFIAHETHDYAHTGEKDAVDADGNPVFQQMDASALIPVMWAEIQSLRARVAALESN